MDDSKRMRLDQRILALEADKAALVDALGTAIGLLWDHCEGIAPRIESLEATLAKHGGDK